MSAPLRRVLGHSGGNNLVCYDSKCRLVTCGNDGEVITYPRISEEEEEHSEFELSTLCISAMVCYQLGDGSDVIAVAMDDNTIQAFSSDGSPISLLMRFTSPVTSLAVSKDHTHLAAGSSEFTIKVLELGELPYSLTGHEAPLLCVTFDPTGSFLASSSCDGSVRVWSVSTRKCVKVLSVLPKSNDVSLAASLCQLSWEPSGSLLAIPVGSEVKVYKSSSWNCVYTLSDKDYHKEALNVVRWSPCGGYMACGDKEGGVSVWHVPTRASKLKMKNENRTGITSLEWDPRGRGSPNGQELVFGDVGGYVGVFAQVYPSAEETPEVEEGRDHLAEDSLLMEGIPADDIFGDDDIDDIISNNEVGVANEEEMGRAKALRHLNSEDEEDVMIDQFDASLHSRDEEGGGTGAVSERALPDPKFKEKLIEAYQESWQPSATPLHLQHRFMVYNLVGVVHCHDDNDTPLIEVDFHNSSIHHSFSLPNTLGHTMAALSEEALVLAAGRTEEEKSHLQCVHFSSWGSHKDWSIPLPGKESIVAVTIGNGWIAIATDKQLLRLFTIGGMQREVVSVPGHVTTLAAWGPRLSVVYQTPPCTCNVFSLTVWVLDIQKRKQLHPPHSLPLSHHAHLRWIGFSEEGCLVTHDSKGMVRIHGNRFYGGLSWIPVLDTNKQLGNKNDHYFIVGMTHHPEELRGILCKDLDYPPVHPRPVMSSLSFQMPLCEPELERTEHEREYLESYFITPPGQSAASSEVVQKLMKMFAFSCKAGREFKACEIAGMMPDDQSMNLAMTYASRSHHLRLARQINELIQKKYLEEDGDSEHSDEEGEELVNGGGTNQNSQSYEPEANYAKARASLLSKGPSNVKPTNRFHRRAMPNSRIGSKLNHNVGVAKRGAGPVVNGNKASSGCDETRELFSGSETEEYAESAVLDDDVIGVEGSDDEEERRGEGGIVSGENSPKAFGDNSLRKRSNPFKLTTPVSKRIVADRKGGFLDNITARVDEDNRRKEIKKKTQRDRNSLGGVAGGGVKKKRSFVPQRSIKTSFFKKKPNPAETAPLSEESGDLNGSQVEDNSQSHDLVDDSCDQDTASKDVDMETQGDPDKPLIMSGAEKLASFAFKSK